MRVQGARHLPPEKAVRGGQRALHLIVNNAVVNKLSLVVKLIMPALLTENLLPAVNVGIEHRIQVHMHQVLKILVIAACHRIKSLVGVSHGI